MDEKKKNLLIALVIYVVSAALSFFAFTSVLGGVITSTPTPIATPTKDSSERISFDDNLPKTQECPLNGAKYSKQQEDWWKKHRPLGVMIENHEESRPQSGISFADVVYEAVAEGGITRFLAVFYCQDAGIVGPVRSARTYFLDFISEYADYPLYAHVGGANTPGPANALGQIESYGWQSYNDLNQFSIGFPTFWRDYERMGRTVATEHTMYSTSEKLWAYAAKSRKLSNKDEDGNSWDEDFVPYKFSDDNKSSSESQVVSFSFWEGHANYAVQWTYDPAVKSYLRENGGASHQDKNTGKQIAAKNIVVLFMTEKRANDGYEGNLHMIYGTKGTGKALIFMGGEQVTGTWSKRDRTSRLIVKDQSGSEIKFDRGLIWFEVLATGSPVVVK